ncbi:MAG: DUF86 domain-containing protein [Treponema sp.]|nr:DUF86 domain-containing protein [Treponema sp.]
MDKDTTVIKHIIKHIENALKTQERFGSDYNNFISDKDYFNSVCMSLLQIGELANHLSNEFTEIHSDIPWRNIIGLRHVVVHGYGQLDAEIIWTSLTEDLPGLFVKCKALIEK